MSIGFWQIVIILVVIFLLFGAKRLPTMMGDLAKGIQAFKKGLTEEDEKPRKLASKKKAGTRKTASKSKTKKASDA